MYAERFDEFQKTLNKSNEVFSTFKKEMDKVCQSGVFFLFCLEKNNYCSATSRLHKPLQDEFQSFLFSVV